MLTSKKTKMVIYTLIAVILVAAVATGCSVTKKDTPWGWAQSVLPEQMAENDGIDTKLMAQILNELDKPDFTLNKTFAGGTDMLIILYEGEQYPFILKGGESVVTLKFDGDFWDIASPELFSFVRNCIQSNKQLIEIKTEVDGSIPQAVIDYATDYTMTQLLYFTNDFGYKITEAKIVGITQISTGTAGLNDGLSLYLLEYRFLPENADSIIIDGGIHTELVDGEQWLIEWGSKGQPYLLLHWKLNDSETVWERICVTDADTITQNYGTAEMLDRYGNMYTAAAIELYAQYSAETPKP